MRAVRLGLAGCGRIAQVALLRSLRQLPGAELVALADSSPGSREEAARHVPGALVFADYRELLAEPSVDALVIALPPALHAEAALAAMQVGKHAYIEKPLAIDLNEARAVLREQERTGLVAMLGFNFRFHPLYSELRRQIGQGRVGTLVAARTVFCAAPRRLPAWKEARRTGGGALLDLGSHHIDLVRYLFEQEVAEVWAAVRSVRSEQDTVSLHLRLEHGLLVQSIFSMTAAEEDRFEVYGDAGRLAVDRYRSRAIQFTPAKRAIAPRDRLADGLAILGRESRQVRDALRPPSEDSYRLSLLHFVEAVRAGRPMAIHLLDGIRSLAVVSAAEESVSRGGAVTLPTSDAGSAPSLDPAPEPGRGDRASGPELSVVVASLDGFRTMRRTVAALRAQTVHDRIELILVGPTEEGLASQDPHDTDGFFAVHTLAVGPIENPDRAAAPGIRIAKAPVVAIVEDHAYPEPNWAAALLGAHEGPWAAVGSVMENANPGTALSWANLLLAYGTWVEPVAGGETTSVSRHNLSYKRAVLEQYGAQLETYLGRDGGFLERLRKDGHRFYLEPAARIHHANPSRFSSTVALRLNGGRLYGATRSHLEHWSPLRRTLYVLGGPLIPLVRARPIQHKVFRAGLFPRAYPALLLCLVLDGIGQMLGYALGPGGSAHTLADFEVDRLRHMTARDRHELGG